MDEREKLLDALQVIKETCEKNGACHGCPLGNVLEQCMVADDDVKPMEWKLNRPTGEWRALL